LTTTLIFKVIVVLMIICIFASLTGGLVFLVRDQGKSDRTVKSLTLRIALSVALFILLLIGFATGLIQPHGLRPGP
jgi:hypothetical protein